MIVPKTVLGQWQNELYTLFGIETQEGSLSPDAFIGAGVFLASRDFAGSEKGSSLLRSVAPFNLCVIDEAHEIFAGIHKRFDRYGYYKEDSKDAQMAHRVRQVFNNVPKLLLTATPSKTPLVELWGLTQYIEPTGALLGNLRTFREVFCDGDDRSLSSSTRPTNCGDASAAFASARFVARPRSSWRSPSLTVEHFCSSTA